MTLRAGSLDALNSQFQEEEGFIPRNFRWIDVDCMLIGLVDRSISLNAVVNKGHEPTNVNLFHRIKNAGVLKRPTMRLERRAKFGGRDSGARARSIRV